MICTHTHLLVTANFTAEVMRVANLKNVLLAEHDKQRKHPENAIWYSA